MNTDEMELRLGIPERFRSQAVELYDEAFGQKLSVAINRKDDRLKIFGRGMCLDFAFGAVLNDSLLGIAGFQTSQGSLTDGVSYADMISRLGLWQGNKAAAVLSFYDRKLKLDELLMDGIAVAKQARGLGIGSRLLDEILTYAKQHHFKQVRLDVIDTNNAAKRLYERKGFVATNTEAFEMLRCFLGFGGSTTMVYTLI